jgi:hypothetical protein
MVTHDAALGAAARAFGFDVRGTSANPADPVQLPAQSKLRKTSRTTRRQADGTGVDVARATSEYWREIRTDQHQGINPEP